MPWQQLICDGCGQTAGQQHLARRLKRLENMTRYRPVHVQSLFLAAVSPAEDGDYLYSAENEFRGEGLALLRALGIDSIGRPKESVLADFQRRGYLLMHVLQCPEEPDAGKTGLEALEKQLAVSAVQIRRSLKPKKLVLLGRELDAVVEKLMKETLGAELLLPETGRAFRLEELAPGALEVAIRTTAVPAL
jgi:hypothetical protein